MRLEFTTNLILKEGAPVQDSIKASKLQFDFLIRTHTYIHDYIRFADTKAGAILAACSVIIACLINNIGKILIGIFNSQFPLVLLLLGAILVGALAFSFFRCALCIIPRVKSSGPGLIYWDQIINNDNYHKEISSLTEEQAIQELATHIQAISKIARQKYIHVRWGVIGLALAFADIVVLIVWYIVQKAVNQ